MRERTENGKPDCDGHVVKTTEGERKPRAKPGGGTDNEREEANRRQRKMRKRWKVKKGMGRKGRKTRNGRQRKRRKRWKVKKGEEDEEWEAEEKEKEMVSEKRRPRASNGQ